jgi:hypothetical protein
VRKKGNIVAVNTGDFFVLTALYYCDCAHRLVKNIIEIRVGIFVVFNVVF